jgi:mannose-6-phosphate isomerase
LTEPDDVRPWGSYFILEDEPGHKVKRIVVSPGKRLSYQRHAKRAEHWFVVAGSGVVTLDGVDHDVQPGVAIDIPIGAAHRIANRGTSVSFQVRRRGDRARRCTRRAKPSS